MGAHDDTDHDGWSVSALRELFRNLQAFHAYFEAGGNEELSCEGVAYCLWDVQRLYDYSQRALPRRQREAIFLCLYQNVLEKKAAVMMGVSPTNPVAMYATRGLEKVIEDLREGLIPGMQGEIREAG